MIKHDFAFDKNDSTLFPRIIDSLQIPFHKNKKKLLTAMIYILRPENIEAF